MKNLTKVALLLLVASIGLMAPSVSVASNPTKEQLKERQAIKKMTKAELNEKASKDARKEAKELKKQGWKATPGSLPIERQLDRCYLMQMEYDDDFNPKYIMGEGMSVGEVYDAAKMQAIELAKQQIISKIESDMASIITNDVSNKQMTSEQAASIAESVNKSKTIIKQKLNRVLTVMEVYRTLGNSNKEVLVRIAYNAGSATDIAKKAIKEDLKAKGEALTDELNALLSE